MKYGVADYGMNVWFGGFYDLESRLLDLRGIGFNGIERLEANDAADALTRAGIFHKLGMDFATVRVPRVDSGIQYTSAFGKDYVWFNIGPGDRKTDLDDYVRRANAFCEACRRWNVTAAIHNHLGSAVESQDELDYFMKNVPAAKLLLDIGHLASAKGDAAGTLAKYYDRLAAIHFKDIFIKDESIGLDKWQDRLRFCELGAGNAGLDYEACAKFLKEKNCTKWILVEHDTHLRDPYIDLKVSLDKLRSIMD